jgi:hypothetical protein
MGDMALDVPPPSADAEQGMDDMPDPTAGIGDGEETPTDPVAGGPDDDPLAGDPNALSAGQGDDISQKYQQLSPDQQDAADKYIDSMLNDDAEAPAAEQQPMESRFNFKNIIDEVFGERDGNVNPLDRKIERDEPMVNQESVIDSINPYMPR